jgi:hypothetical protein
MAQVQASIQILLDFHMDGTAKLAAMTPLARQAFLDKCASDLHKGDIARFLALCQGPTFRPILTLEAGTSHPSLFDINKALVDAVCLYNEQGFGFKFDIDFEATAQTGVNVPPYTCVQWVWVDGQWVRKYNYDLAIAAGTPHKGGGLTAAYRVALSYA